MGGLPSTLNRVRRVFKPDVCCDRNNLEADTSKTLHIEVVSATHQQALFAGVGNNINRNVQSSENTDTDGQQCEGDGEKTSSRKYLVDELKITPTACSQSIQVLSADANKNSMDDSEDYARPTSEADGSSMKDVQLRADKKDNARQTASNERFTQWMLAPIRMSLGDVVAAVNNIHIDNLIEEEEEYQSTDNTHGSEAKLEMNKAHQDKVENMNNSQEAFVTINKEPTDQTANCLDDTVDKLKTEISKYADAIKNDDSIIYKPIATGVIEKNLKLEKRQQKVKTKHKLEENIYENLNPLRLDCTIWNRENGRNTSNSPCGSVWRDARPDESSMDLQTDYKSQFSCGKVDP